MAHGPEHRITALQIVTKSDGRFLVMRVDPLQDGSTLLAVSTPFGSATLERRKDSDYEETERIPLTHDQRDLGATTSYRIRLHELPKREQVVPVTLLFSGGTMVRAQAEVAWRSDSHHFLMAAGAAALALLTLLTVRIISSPGVIKVGKG